MGRIATGSESGNEHAVQADKSEDSTAGEREPECETLQLHVPDEKGSDSSAGQTEESKEVTSEQSRDLSIYEGDEKTEDETESESGNEHAVQADKSEDSTAGEREPEPETLQLHVPDEKGSDSSAGQTEESKEVTSEQSRDLLCYYPAGDEKTKDETESESGNEHAVQADKSEDSTAGEREPEPETLQLHVPDEKGSDSSAGQTEESKEVTSEQSRDLLCYYPAGDEKTEDETESESGNEHAVQADKSEDSTAGEREPESETLQLHVPDEKGSDSSAGQTEESKEVTSEQSRDLSIYEGDEKTEDETESESGNEHAVQADKSEDSTAGEREPEPETLQLHVPDEKGSDSSAGQTEESKEVTSEQSRDLLCYYPAGDEKTEDETESESGNEHAVQADKSEDSTAGEREPESETLQLHVPDEKGSDSSAGQTEESKEVTSEQSRDLSIYEGDEKTEDETESESGNEHAVQADKSEDSTAGEREPESETLQLHVPDEKGSDSSAGQTEESKEVTSEQSRNLSIYEGDEKSEDETESESGNEHAVQADKSEDSTAGEREPESETLQLHVPDEKGSDSSAGQTEESKEVTSEQSRDLLCYYPAGDEKTEDETEQLVTISEEISREEASQEEIEKLLARLHLQDNLPQFTKLLPADFLKIGPPVKLHHVTSEKDRGHTFLKRLIMLDYRARYIPVKSNNPEETYSEFSNVDEFLNTSVDAQMEQTHVHPMDVQMAVFHCSDNFLKQMMITKLSQCQYALPLLVPDPITKEIECPLWTMRQITKTWKVSKDESHTVTLKSMPIYKAKTPLVSFFRLGSHSVSKSQLMNTLINDRHSTFFHRDCPGSTKSHCLMYGVAEIAWYCPAGKPNDVFNDCIAFCNLHGDALSIEKQRDILIEKSSINVVFVSTKQKDEKITSLMSVLFESEKPLIYLVVDDGCFVFDKKRGKYKIGIKDRSQSDVSERLKNTIREILFSPDSSWKTTFQLETMAELQDISVDESEPACKEGKSAAMKIVDSLTKDSMDVSKIKDKLFPCQGQLWHQWSKIHKELYHLRGHIENEKSKKQQALKNIRKKQCAASCSELMELFIGCLSSLPPTKKKYFLKWTQIFIDALATNDVSLILQSYDETWSEVLTLKNKHDKSDLLLRKQTELEKISKKLHSATFGLEHIFREMGQIYEAHRAIQREDRHSDWSKYPEVAAQLMISGHPLELMDGDAGHVPLTWISSVLEEVIKELGDQRVFVLSVLGVQSSGKSTMLNTMFGLQFAVSAGRCTKGAFMQLLKVSEEIKKDYKFDYVLVVDTEGLRALELEGNNTRHHDNELATFVVGLGNLTLINIFGENPSEMQDILQIVVQAFMRMKKVKLSPSCVFVHQNVTDVAAAEKNMDGKRRLQDKLDKMAKLAAKEEVCNADCFSDVIEFDIQKDVKYCAQLWEGSPPMAPPNPGYSESIQELKNVILTKASKYAGITLSQFKTKIQDLWNALLNENFVFSFKNTLEIAVYRKLEVQYGNWTWTLRSRMLTIESQLHNRIENGKLDSVEVSYLNKETNKTYDGIKKEMKNHFEDDTEKEILAQWRGRFEIKIKEFREEQVSKVKRKLDEVIQQKKARKKLDDKKPEFENKLLQKSKELAQQLKDKAKDEEELQKQFNSVWRGWVTEIATDQKPVQDINLEEDQYTLLQELGFEQALIDYCKIGGRYKKLLETGDYSEYVSLPKNQDLCETKHIQHKRLSTLPYEEQQQIVCLTEKAEKESLHAVRSKPIAARGYTSTYLQEVAKNIKEEVEKFQSKRNYSLKKEFTVDLLLYVFDSVESWLLESQRKFKINNDALTYLESKKTQYYNIFRSFCKGNSSAVVLGELVCEKLKVSTVEAVCNKTAISLAGEMRCNLPAFSENRLNLEKYLLKSLAEKEDFDDFRTYIRNPRRKTEAFIKAEVEKYIFKDHKDKAVNILQKNVEDINKLVEQALFTATKKVKTQSGDINMWLQEFSILLKDELTFDTPICSENFSDTNFVQFFTEEIKKGFRSITEQMKSLSLDKLKESRQKPEEILIEQLCKCCWVTCPFCAAVCTNTIEDHSPDDHAVPFHRAAGINGMHWKDTVEFDIDFCTTNVASDFMFNSCHAPEEWFPYKEYRKAGPKYANWKITPDESKLAYWKWFACTFKEQLEKHYNLTFEGRGEIPSDWKDITKKEAIKSLNEMCE
ncbi:interferon-induced very large GTPase 1-like [Archocentrus centrarchus]|uniref:interferon-induced very large GTPase 1-like n=1 Tax=Archocentrus centrarchus TaxID=63155 RepID=UPI0011E9BB37|nr:interferon-induced very large GTPase 1-like [Archocentrus centrarchus]